MIEIIPAIDLIDGRCVRLLHGDFESKTVYSDDPVETAKKFEAAGIRRLHMVDLDGARSGEPKNIAVLERVARNTQLVIDFGGGIKTETNVQNVFDAGASIANIGSLAVKEPQTFLGWIERFGGERILLGADCKEGRIAIDGWQTETQISILDLLGNFTAKGVMSAFVTDIGHDGAMGGPSIELYEEIVEKLPRLNLIASGGVSDCEDIDELDRIGCSGVIVGKAIYEGAIKLDELAKYVG